MDLGDIRETQIVDPIMFKGDYRCNTCNDKMEAILEAGSLDRMWLRCKCTVVIYKFESAGEVAYAVVEHG